MPDAGKTQPVSCTDAWGDACEHEMDIGVVLKGERYRMEGERENGEDAA
jgi:hypothetical protein